MENPEPVGTKIEDDVEDIAGEHPEMAVPGLNEDMEDVE
jgi:hypothetical protein